MKDLYRILGVSKAASQADIKVAYRKLAEELHPDLHPGKTTVAERFKEVAAAYHLLNDKDARMQYDRGEIDADGLKRRAQRPSRRRQAPPRPRRPVNGNGHNGHAASRFEPFSFGAAAAEDLFSGLFGNRKKGQPNTFQARGADRAYTLVVPFLAAARGGRRRAELRHGRTVEVAIPQGITEGRTIRLKHQGDPGFGGAEPGDALIDVQIEPHPYFTRRDDDIYIEVPVTVQEAVLGAKISRPHHRRWPGRSAAVTGPTPGTVIRRRQTGSTRPASSIIGSIRNLGEFNRSSQHVQFDWPASTGPELRREFSIRGSCGAVY